VADADPAPARGRPALATAGGVLLAVALLQTVGQILSAFNPRPSVQAALAAAVGLGALTAERLREGHGRRERVALGAAGGCLGAVGAAAAISLTAGFSKPAPVPVSEQVAALRATLTRAGYDVAYRQLSLAEGKPVHLLVLTRRPRSVLSAPPVSDEVRLYGLTGGKLHQLLAYRPRVIPYGVDNRGRRTPVGPHPGRFHVVSVVDINGDGQREVVGSWDLNLAGIEHQRLAVMLWRAPASGRYTITPLLSAAPLGLAADGLDTFNFGPPGSVAPAVWALTMRLDTDELFVPEAATLASTVPMPEADPWKLIFRVGVAPAGKRAPSFVLGVRLWRIDVGDTGRPRVRPLCPLGGQPNLGPFSIAVTNSPALLLGAPLARAITTAGIGVGELIRGQCLEAAS
jgi:hypothetical protein